MSFLNECIKHRFTINVKQSVHLSVGWFICGSLWFRWLTGSDSEQQLTVPQSGNSSFRTDGRRRHVSRSRSRVLTVNLNWPLSLFVFFFFSCKHLCSISVCARDGELKGLYYIIHVNSLSKHAQLDTLWAPRPLTVWSPMFSDRDWGHCLPS